MSPRGYVKESTPTLYFFFMRRETRSSYEDHNKLLIKIFMTIKPNRTKGKIMSVEYNRFVFFVNKSISKREKMLYKLIFMTD